ncbi:MAG TPA: hypothetical protein VGD27_16920 [Longimicrobiales bacterium]
MNNIGRYLLVFFGMAAILFGVYVLVNMPKAPSPLSALLVGTGTIIGGVSLVRRARAPNA